MHCYSWIGAIQGQGGSVCVCVCVCVLVCECEVDTVNAVSEAYNHGAYVDTAHHDYNSPDIVFCANTRVEAYFDSVFKLYSLRTVPFSYYCQFY